jgi:drug/metabolite transporter (DMT)-like permease
MRVAIPLPKPAAVNAMPFLITAFCLLWSSAFAVAKVALADCPPLLLLTARFLLAGAVMLAAAALDRSHWQLARRDLGILALLGVTNNALYLGLNYVGMQSISAGLSALIVSANPVLTAVLATFFLGERMTLRRVAGLLLGIGGVGFIVESRIAGGIDDPTGIALTVAALVSLVVGTILFKRLTPNGGLWIGNGLQNLVGGLALAPFAFGFESVGEVVLSWRLVFALGYLALFVSVLGFLLWFHLLTVMGATSASAYHFLMPPLGMLFGWLLLGEHVAWSDLLGILPVALGIYLVTRPARSWELCSQNGRTNDSECGRMDRSTLAAFIRNAKRHDAVSYATAIDDWESDLAFLHEKYYIHYFNFGYGREPQETRHHARSRSGGAGTRPPR